MSRPYIGYSAWYEQFPYQVQISDDVDRATHQIRYDWLLSHVGTRDETWCYPNATLVRFKREHDAILFSLTWS